MQEFYEGDFAQSVTIHHYEKWIDIKMVHEMAMYFENHLHEPSDDFTHRLKKFTLGLLKDVSSHILDLTIQQHSTTSFSLSENTLRNCLIYSLSRDMQIILRLMEDNLTEWESNQIYTVNVPNLAATLHMIYENENRLPCIMQTKDIREMFSEYFGTNLKID